MTAERRASLRRISDRAAHRFFELEDALLCKLDFEARFATIGAGWQSLLGYEPAELEGRPWIELVHPEDLDRTLGELAKLLATDTHVRCSNRCRRRDGDYRWLRWELLSDAANGRIDAVAVDVTEQRELEAGLAGALRDELTGLPNRALFIDRVDYALAQLERRRSHVAVIALDIDDFQVLTDTLGRLAGSEVLHEVAERLAEVVRATDTVARIGGDEFGVLCPDSGERAVLEIAQRVAGAVSKPVSVHGHELVPSASAGIAVAGGPRLGELLVADAEVALHRARSNGAGRIEFFDPELRAASVTRLKLQAALRSAIANDELTLALQPIVSLSDGLVLAYEALARWHPPELGAIPPERFIPLAEETGLILPLGDWALRTACAAAAEWGDQGGSRSPAVTVNVSARQLARADFAANVGRALEASGLEPHRLWLEVTETAVMAQPQEALSELTTLRELGVEVAVDDFGEGHASLYRLKLLGPVSILKIGMTLVERVHEQEARDPAIIRAIVGLADSIGLRTVAEGVETEEQMLAVRELGCDAAQGFYFGRPVAGQAPTG